MPAGWPGYPQSGTEQIIRQLAEILFLFIVQLSPPKYLLRTLFACLWLLLLSSQVRAADSLNLAYTDIAKIHLQASSYVMKTRIAMAYVAPEKDVESIFSEIKFVKGQIHPSFIPVEQVPDQLVVKFAITNSADTVRSTWFFPGLYFWSIRMYRLHEDGRLEKLEDRLPDHPKEISYRYLQLAAGDSATIVAVMAPSRTHLNQLRIRLISPPFLESFVIALDNTNIESKIFTYVFCGLLLMMILFSMANYFLSKSKEFFYYSVYAFLIGVMLFMKGIYSYHSSTFGFYQEGYLDFILQSVGTMFYMRFVQQYLNTKRQHRFLHHFYNGGILMLILAVLVFSYAHYFTWNFTLENYAENSTKALLLVMIFVFLVYGVRHWDNRLFRYLFWGNLSLLMFSLLSLLMLTGRLVPQNMPSIFNSSVFYYEMGILLELIFFLMGLNYKNRSQLIAQARERERLKAENMKNAYEKEIAVYKGQQEERERISADMHDELGSGMTAIRLMSEIARNKMKENTPVEIEKISRSADEVLNKMNAIIWSMNSGNDSVDNLVSYIRSYAIEFFESTPINCKVYTPDNINQHELSGDKRRNLFLCVKETLNNALKHSKANEIRIYFVTDDILTIKIADNGVGIDLENIRRFGNGLKNIAKRMENIGGTYHIENNQGTITTLRLPI